MDTQTVYNKQSIATPAFRIFTNSLISSENLIYLLEERFALGDTLAYAYCILYIESEANQYNK